MTERVSDRLVAALLALALAASLTAVSCGGDAERTPAKAEVTPAPTVSHRGQLDGSNIVGASDIARTTAGSAKRAVLEFAQAIQFRDAASALRRVSPAKLGKDRPKLRLAIRAIGPSLGRPVLVGGEQRSNTASVRAVLVSYDNSGEVSLRQPVVFRLQKLGGQWLLTDTSLLLQTYRDLQARKKRDAPRPSATP